jgi:hypothetical protein
MLLKQQCFAKIIVTYERLKFVAVQHLENEIAASLIEGYIWTFRVNMYYVTLYSLSLFDRKYPIISFLISFNSLKLFAYKF